MACDSVNLLQPAGEDLAVFLVGIDEAGVTGMAEQMPSTLRDILVKRGGNNGGTDVTRAAADKCGLRDLA